MKRFLSRKQPHSRQRSISLGFKDNVRCSERSRLHGSNRWQLRASYLSWSSRAFRQLSPSLSLLRATIPADKAWAKEVQRKSAQNTVGDSAVISPKNEKVSSSGVRTDLASARRIPRHSLPSCTFAYRKCGSGSTFARVRGSFLAFRITSRRAVSDESPNLSQLPFVVFCWVASSSRTPTLAALRLESAMRARTPLD